MDETTLMSDSKHYSQSSPERQWSQKRETILKHILETQEDLKIFLFWVFFKVAFFRYLRLA